MKQPEDKYLDLKGLSHYSAMAVPTLRDYLAGGTLPYFKLKGKILVKQSEFDAWLENFRVEKRDIRSMADDIMKKLKSDTYSEGHR